MTDKAPDFYIATTDFFIGDEPKVQKGEVFRRGHRLVKAAPAFFEPYDIDRPDVEQATAAPGEKRK